MSEQGAEAPGGDAGTVTETPAAAVITGTPAATVDNDFLAALDADTRKTVDAKGWKNPLDAVKGALKSSADMHRELTDTKAKSLLRPGDDAKPEDWDGFYEKMGRPKTPGEYSFKLPEGLPENFPYDQQSADKFKVWAHEAGLPPREAQRLHDEYVKDAAKQMQDMAAKSAQAAASAHEALVKGFGNPADAWGEEGSESYKRKQELANRTLRQQGGSELIAEMKAIGALGPNGEVKSPRLAMALAKIGGELYAEDTLFGGVNGGGSNPFSDKTTDLTKQGQIIRSNPDHARALIRQAGHDPKEWAL